MRFSFFITFIGLLFLICSVYLLWESLHSSHNQEPSFVLTPLPPDKSILESASKQAISEHIASNTPVINTEPRQFKQYLTIDKGCSLITSENCIRAYNEPNASSTERYKLRIGTVLLIKQTTTTSDGLTWHEIGFEETLRYKERLELPWYVSADAGTVIENFGPHELSTSTPTTTKYFIVDRSEQTLYAYDNSVLVSSTSISTGIELTPTPRGTFRIYKMTPTRYMQGPIPGISTKYYDLPGVPWNLYFTKEGAVVHGAYWHDNFGNPHSNGCVNVDPEQAKKLYDWAEIGMFITVRD